MVFSLKLTKKDDENVFKFYLMSELTLNHPVSAIACNESYLFISSGSSLFQIKINAETRKIMIGGRSIARDVAKSIKTTTEQDIYVAGAQESLAYYSFVREEKKIKFISSDSKSRSALDCWPIVNEFDTEKVVICTFKSGAIAGFRFDQSKVLQVLFSFNSHALPIKILPASCVMTPNSVISPHNASILYSDCDIPWDTNISGPLMALSVCNTRVAMLRISDEVYSVLEKVRDVMLQYPATKPFLGISKAFETSEYGECMNAVDGRFLGQFLELRDEEKQEICNLVTQPKIPYKNWKDVESLIYRLCEKSY